MGVMADIVLRFKQRSRGFILGIQRWVRKRKSAQLTAIAKRSFQVLSRREKASDEVCYFSSFDPDSIVSDHVLHAIRAWVEAGVDVVFVSTSKSIGEDDRAKL